MDYAQIFTAPTPQTQPIRGQEHKMAPNAAGGFGYKLDVWDRLKRFLILGTEGGTYYASEQKLTLDNLAVVQEALTTDGRKLVHHADTILFERRSPKPDAAIFALALAAVKGDEKTKEAAYTAVMSLATPTQLFKWCEQFKTLGGGFASGFQRAINGWYAARSGERLAYQVTKYRMREGWKHLDALRLGHPTYNVAKQHHDIIFRYLRTGKVEVQEKNHVALDDKVVAMLHAFEAMQAMTTPEQVVEAIKAANAPREWVPTELLKHPEVWSALALNMPPVATFRNLGAMASRDLLKELSDTEKAVIARIEAGASEVHPIQVLLALGVYGTGHGEKGSLFWDANQRIVKALEAAWETSLNTAPVIGKNVLVGVDISGSMEHPLNGYRSLSMRKAACAIGLWLTKREPNSVFTWYDTACYRAPVTDLQTMLQHRINPVGTDCSQPMLFAIKEDLPIDLFVCITDNESWAGHIHPSEALEQYRKKSGRDAKLVTLAMSPILTSIGDPTSANHLNVVGLDSNFPTLLREFAGVGAVGVGGERNKEAVEEET